MSCIHLGVKLEMASIAFVKDILLDLPTSALQLTTDFQSQSPSEKFPDDKATATAAAAARQPTGELDFEVNFRAIQDSRCLC